MTAQPITKDAVIDFEARAKMKKPGHFTKRETQMFNKWTGSLGKFLLGKPIAPTDAHYDAFARMTLEGDPTADRVVEWFREVGVKEGRAQLDKALEEGIDALDNPHQCLIDLFAEIDAEPVWLDRDLLDIAAKATHRSGIIGGLVLGDLALMGGYAISTVMNRSLVFTGALNTGAEKRLRETGKWWLDVTSTKGLDRNGVGFKSATQVRIMHALVRARLKVHPKWDYEELGMPISQAHMLATNQAFSVLFLYGCSALGIKFSKKERHAIMHMWRYLAFLNGVDPHQTSEDEADCIRVLWLSVTSQPPADEDAVALAKGLAETSLFGETDNQLLRAVSDVMDHVRLGLTRMLGSEIYDGLELPKDKAWRLAPVGIRAVTEGTELARRLTPGGTHLAERTGRWLQEQALNGKDEDASFKPAETFAKETVKEAAE